MCSQTFHQPSDWVRHIELTHADIAEGRRRRRKVRTTKYHLISWMLNEIIIVCIIFTGRSG